MIRITAAKKLRSQNLSYHPAFPPSIAQHNENTGISLCACRAEGERSERCKKEAGLSASDSPAWGIWCRATHLSVIIEPLSEYPRKRAKKYKDNNKGNKKSRSNNYTGNGKSLAAFISILNLCQTDNRQNQSYNTRNSAQEPCKKRTDESRHCHRIGFRCRRTCNRRRCLHWNRLIRLCLAVQRCAAYRTKCAALLHSMSTLITEHHFYLSFLIHFTYSQAALTVLQSSKQPFQSIPNPLFSSFIRIKTHQAALINMMIAVQTRSDKSAGSPLILF